MLLESRHLSSRRMANFHPSLSRTWSSTHLSLWRTNMGVSKLGMESRMPVRQYYMR